MRTWFCGDSVGLHNCFVHGRVSEERKRRTCRYEHGEGKGVSDWGQKGLAVCATDQRINLVRFYRPPRPGSHVAAPPCTTVDCKNTPL